MWSGKGNKTPLRNKELRKAVREWYDGKFGVREYYGNISTWNVSECTEMSELFKNMKEFNDDISQWDVSNVTAMQQMFQNAAKFNQDVSRWDVSKVKNRRQMFSGAKAFNKDYIMHWAKPPKKGTQPMNG